MRHQTATDAGPIRIPLKRMVQIRRCSASFSAITKGRYRHQNGSANIIVTRKMRRTGPQDPGPAEEQTEESGGKE